MSRKVGWATAHQKNILLLSCHPRESEDPIVFEIPIFMGMTIFFQ